MLDLDLPELPGEIPNLDVRTLRMQGTMLARLPSIPGVSIEQFFMMSRAEEAARIAAAIGIAFQGLQRQYDEANGYEGRMLQGRAPSSSGEVFRSQAELVAAMGDPRYDNDPAYRADVVAKLNNSDLNF